MKFIFISNFDCFPGSKVDDENSYLATTFGDGSIIVYNILDGNVAYNLQSGSNTALPVTNLRFRPSTSSSTKHVLVTVNASGVIQHWHMTSGKCINTIYEKDNSIYALDYNCNATNFITAGLDHTIRYTLQLYFTHILSYIWLYGCMCIMR